MKSTVCPNCLTGELEVVVVFDGDDCRRCKKAPEIKLTRREIESCLEAKYGIEIR